MQDDVDVGGMDSSNAEADEYLTWHRAKLELGDEIVTQLVECEEADAPLEVKRETKKGDRYWKRKELDQLRERVSELERELGEDA